MYGLLDVKNLPIWYIKLLLHMCTHMEADGKDTQEEPPRYHRGRDWSDASTSLRNANDCQQHQKLRERHRKSLRREHGIAETLISVF